MIAITSAIPLPWILWNYSVYGTPTAMSRLYGSGKQFLVNPVPMRNSRDIAIGAQCFTAYHSMPTEFWLSQFKTPLPIKIFAVLIMLVTYAGSVYALIRREYNTYRRLFLYCAAVYTSNSVAWLALALLYSNEPFRGFLGCLFAFSFLLMRSISYLEDKIFKNTKRTILLAGIPIVFLLLNCYLAFLKVPQLPKTSVYSFF